jgi:hypothetical protein
LQQAIAQFEAQQKPGDRYSAETLSKLTGVSTSSIRRLWAARSGLDQKTLEQIFKAFELELTPADFLRLGESASPTMQRSVYRYPDGPLALGSELYIARSPVEELAFQEITQIGCIVRIKAPPKFGKSSLLLRVLDQAQQADYANVFIDLQQVPEPTLSNPDRFLPWFVAAIATKLGLQPNVASVWNELVGSQLSATLYMRNEILAASDRPLVLGLNDLTVLFPHTATAQMVLPLLRSWYEEAGHDDRWQRLRLVVTYSTDLYLPLDLNVSPFNVGLPLTLPEFSPAQVMALAQQYHLSWCDSDVEQLMQLVGGHPYLVHLAIYQVHQQQVPLDELLKSASTLQGIYQSHLQTLLALTQELPQLAEPLSMLVSSQQPITLEPLLAFRLEKAGLITGDPEGWQLSRELYRRFLQQTLFGNSQAND